MFTVDTPLGEFRAGHLAYASPGLLEFLAINRKMSNVGPEAVRNLVAAADSAAIAVADMQKAGVGILAGCDAMIGGFCLHDELMLMVKGGMSPPAALQTATINPARALAVEKLYGTVDTDKRADLVLLEANPARRHRQRESDCRCGHERPSPRSSAAGCNACGGENTIQDAARESRTAVNVVLFGATGMVGAGTLLECFADRRVGVGARRHAGADGPEPSEAARGSARRLL
jgi:hypothetical protein